MRIPEFKPDSLGDDDLGARMLHMLRALEHERDLVISQGIEEAQHWSGRFADYVVRLREAPDQTWNSLGEIQGNAERLDLWISRLDSLNEVIRYLRKNLIACGVTTAKVSKEDMKRQVAARKGKKR